jgi:hypothetical protein
MRRLLLLLAAISLVAACADGGDGGLTEGTTPQTTPETTAAAPVTSAWHGPVVLGEVPLPDMPFVDVAVGSDGLPVVAFFDSRTNMVELRRCADAGCVETPSSASIAVPDDIYVEWITVQTGASGSPVLTLEGGFAADPNAPLEVSSRPMALEDEPSGVYGVTYVVACGDAGCGDYESARFENELFPDVVFAEDGAMLLATTTDLTPAAESRDMRLILRRCSDRLCREATSKIEMGLPPRHQMPNLTVVDGNPVIVTGAGSGDRSEGGGGLVSVVQCHDPACSSSEVFETAIDEHSFEFRAAATELPVVGYGVPGTGFTTLGWASALGDPAIPNLIDATPADSYVTAEMQGASPGPVIGYLRFLEEQTENESRQLVVAECGDPVCAHGTLTAVAETTENTGLETNPALTLDTNGDPVLAFHTCEPGCEPQYINVLRCEGGCAAAFPENVIGSWGTMP